MHKIPNVKPAKHSVRNKFANKCMLKEQKVIGEIANAFRREKIHDIWVSDNWYQRWIVQFSVFIHYYS